MCIFSPRIDEEAWYLLKAGEFNRAHMLIVDTIAPNSIINGKYVFLHFGKENFIVGGNSHGRKVICHPFIINQNYHITDIKHR